MRDALGRILPGAVLPEEHRRRISEGQIRRHREGRLQAVALPDRKKCTQCGEWKQVPEDYSMRRRKLKSGEVRSYPPGECKQCSRERAEQWKKDFIAEHGEEAWKEKQKGYNAKRDVKKARAYQREYGRLKRLEQGAKPRGPWKRYRGDTEKDPWLEIEPFRIWCKSHKDDTITVNTAGKGGYTVSCLTRWAEASGKSSRWVRYVLAGEVGKVRLSVVDSMLSAAGESYMMDRLYGGRRVL